MPENQALQRIMAETERRKRLWAQLREIGNRVYQSLAADKRAGRFWTNNLRKRPVFIYLGRNITVEMKLDQYGRSRWRITAPRCQEYQDYPPLTPADVAGFEEVVTRTLPADRTARGKRLRGPF